MYRESRQNVWTCLNKEAKWFFFMNTLHRWSLCLFCPTHRLRPSTVCGMVNVGSPKRCMERNTTATTLVLPVRYLLRIMNFSRYTLFFFLSSNYVFISPSGKNSNSNVASSCFCFFFFSFLISSSRNSAQDMTTEIEVSAAMPTSCTPWKGVSSCPFSFCLGMQRPCNCLMKHMTCSLEGHYHFPFWISEHKDCLYF